MYFLARLGLQGGCAIAGEWLIGHTKRVDNFGATRHKAEILLLHYKSLVTYYTPAAICYYSMLIS